jgi:hypothetical protein
MAAPSLVCKLARSKCHESTLPAAGVLPGFLCRNLQPEERAQGMPGAPRTRSLACEKWKARKQVTTGSPKQSGIPCTMVLRLIPRSPRRSGFLSPSPRNALALSRVDASVEASGPHGFAVRERRIRLSRRPRPSHPALNVRDDRETPLPKERGTGELVDLICPTGQAKYFSRGGWTGFSENCPTGKSPTRARELPLFHLTAASVSIKAAHAQKTRHQSQRRIRLFQRRL